MDIKRKIERFLDGRKKRLAILRLTLIFVPGIDQGVWQAARVGSMTVLLTMPSRFCYTLVYKAATKKGKTAPVYLMSLG